MSNFVYDSTTLNAGKIDRAPIPGDEDPNKWIQATDWNPAMQAMYDLRDVLWNGTYLGFGRQASAPAAPTGASLDRVWMDTSGNLLVHANGVGDLPASLPLRPAYDCGLVLRSNVVKWQQVQELQANYNNTIYEVAVTWPTFGARPFRIYLGNPVTDSTEAILVQVILASISNTGCTIQANELFTGNVPITVKEIVS